MVTDRKPWLRTVSHVAGAGSTVIPASPFQGLRSVRRIVTLINTNTVTNYARFRIILLINSTIVKDIPRFKSTLYGCYRSINIYTILLYLCLTLRSLLNLTLKSTLNFCFFGYFSTYKYVCSYCLVV